MTGKASVTYARALLSVMEGKLAEGAEELRQVEAVLEDQPDYRKLLSSPALPAADRRQLLAPFEERLSPEMYHFLLVLSDHNRFALLPEIARAFYAGCDEALGILRVEAVSAVPLTEEQSARLRQRLSETTGKTVVLSNRVDPAVLGGVRLAMKNQELDGTLRARLDGMRELLAEQIV